MALSPEQFLRVFGRGFIFCYDTYKRLSGTQ